MKGSMLETPVKLHPMLCYGDQQPGRSRATDERKGALSWKLRNAQEGQGGRVLACTSAMLPKGASCIPPQEPKFILRPGIVQLITEVCICRDVGYVLWSSYCQGSRKAAEKHNHLLKCPEAFHGKT